MTGRKRSADHLISVDPAADFGLGHGALVVSDGSRPDQVTIEQADRVVYIPDEWIDQVAAGGVPWATLACRNPWTIGGALKIRGVDGTVIYQITGACGPRVRAYVCEQPD